MSKSSEPRGPESIGVVLCQQTGVELFRLAYIAERERLTTTEWVHDHVFCGCHRSLCTIVWYLLGETPEPPPHFIPSLQPVAPPARSTGREQTMYLDEAGEIHAGVPDFLGDR